MITIVDYGLGNIKAFANVLKKLNIAFDFADTTEKLAHATKLILPGVGSFDHAMTKLNSSGLRDTLDDLVLEKGIPVIGICVGMQMMASGSEEGKMDGLNWIPGYVKHFASERESNLPLPHMGWNNLTLVSTHPLTEGLDAEKLFYFLHSYYFQAEDTNSILATADYGFPYASVVNFKNRYGIQCHPEKSHHNGVALLKNFASL